ncbi:hypothetical protein VP01_201g6 [Puccinia sorghi]|uniref:Uncharacterized protein n=1 Tax=Puccinia sorghi TaxID=27349 RepID=A0A0L6VBS0_9BASI|nr:hypothetical protein VP01_201g6 [Puccinia sorghi]
MPLYDNKPSVINTRRPKVYQQERLSVPLRFQTSHPLLARHPGKITTSSSAVGSLDTPSRKLSSVATSRTRLDRGRRALVDEPRKPESAATTDGTAKPPPAATPSPETARKRVPVVKQVIASTNPPTKLAATPDDAAKPTSKSSSTPPPSNSPATPPAKARVVDPNSPAPTTPSPTNSRTANINTNSLPAKSTPLPSPTPTSETSRGAAAKEDKPASRATPAASKPPVETIPSPSPNPSAAETVTPNTQTETPKITKAPESDSQGNTSQLTSIAIGVACAASLAIFAILVVIFKIRVSRKRSRRQERFGDDFFGSHDRLSFSDSDGSGSKPLFVPPRPIASQVSSSTPGAEKPMTSGYPNLTGIGAHSPRAQSLADSARTYPPAPLNLQSSAYSHFPPRPPRSPLRPQATHNPGVYHRAPQGISGPQSYTPDNQSVYSSHSARGKAEMSEFYGQPTPDYNYALEYLNNYYPTSHADSTYQASHAPGDIIGMDLMHVEDRPYDARYTVDRNGVLNNYAPSIRGAGTRDSDYYYKKRIP